MGDGGRDAGGVDGNATFAVRVGEDGGKNDAVEEEVLGLDGDSRVKSSSLLRMISSKSASSAASGSRRIIFDALCSLRMSLGSVGVSGTIIPSLLLRPPDLSPSSRTGSLGSERRKLRNRLSLVL